MGSAGDDFLGTARFDVRRRLGAGGMGVVYEVFDREKKIAVALKTLRQTSADAILRFKREFRAVHQLQHRNLIRLGELAEENGTWFFTMELLRGVSFLAHVRPGHAAESTGSTDATAPMRAGDTLPMHAPAPIAGHFDEVRLRDGLVQLARGLSALHDAGMIHRDIKPSNLLVDGEGRLVLLDFGLVADLEGDISALTGSYIVGTAAYMAPEQAAGGKVGPAADWYSVGAVLYEALVGEPPFSGANLRVLMVKQQLQPVRPGERVADVPPDLDVLCMQLLSIDPALRPSGAEFLARLGARRWPAATAAPTDGHTLAPIFVGRDAELAELDSALAEVARGQPLAVEIHGEPGIGKSTLIRRFCEHAGQREGVLVLAGRCHERESMPFKLLDGVVDAMAYHLGRWPRAEAATCVPRYASLLLGVFPVLRRVNVLAEAPRHEVTGPLELRARVFAALRELLTRVAERRTLIVSIDDVQWADADGRDLLDHLVRPPEAPPFLLLLGARSSSEPGKLPSPTRRLELSRLTHAAAGELAAGLLKRIGGGNGTSPSSIADEARGHPLFIDELVRALVDRGDDRPRLGLVDVLWQRIERLEPPARNVLEVVCVAGAPIDQETAAHASGISLAELTPLAVQLRLANLVRLSGLRGLDEVEPYHDVVRETVTARLPPDRSTAAHRALARALERREDAPPEELARHHQAGGDRELAATSLTAAAERAMSKLAFQRAAALYAAAIESSGTKPVPLLRARGQALALAGDAQDAAEVFLAAAARSEGAEQLGLYRLAADNLLRSGRVREALAALRGPLAAVGIPIAKTRRGAFFSVIWRRLMRGSPGFDVPLRPIDQLSPRELGRVDSLYAASTTLGMLDHIRGADVQTSHAHHAVQLGEEGRLIRALAIDAIFQANLAGRHLAPATRLASEAELRARRMGDPLLLGVATLAVAGVAFFSSRHRAAYEAFREAERIFRCECVGAEWERISAQYVSLTAAINLGELRANAEQTAQCMERAEQRTDVYARSLFSAEPNSWRHIVADRPELAERASLQALDYWPKDDFLQVQLYINLGYIATLLYSVRTDEARARLERVRMDMDRSYVTFVPYMEQAHASYWGIAALRRDDRRTAKLCARRLARLGQAGPGLAQLYLAVVAAREDRRDEAVHLGVNAIRLLEANEHFAKAHAARWQLGHYLGEREGGHLIAEAAAWFQREGVVDRQRLADVLAPEFTCPAPTTTA